MAVLPVSVCAWDCWLHIAVYCSHAWVTWWLGSSGTSLDFVSPQWATVGLAIWMDLLKNGNMTGLWELPLVEDFLSLNLHWCGYDFLKSALRKNVLVSSLTRRWITATKFGRDINALFENVCTLWFLSKWLSVFIFMWVFTCTGRTFTYAEVTVTARNISTKRRSSVGLIKYFRT